jgi:asparagine synthase (glutamine-hydrolysing)
MGAIFGFTGPPDPGLRDRLIGHLAHRGDRRRAPRVQVHAESTLGRLPSREPHPAAPPVDWGPDRVLCGLAVPAGADPRDGAGSPTAAHPTANGASTDSSPRHAEAGAEGLTRTPSLTEALAWATALRGPYVAAVRSGHRLILMRDCTGRRTLYCARFEGRWIFAIEPKSLWQLPGFPRRLRPAAVAQFLSFSFIPGSGTMLEGIYEVPAGTAAVLDPRCSTPEWHRFCEPESEPPPDARSDTEWVDHGRSLIGQAVADLLPDPGAPQAVFLSGGIDSSLVTAELCRQARAPVHSYAIHFGDRYPNELAFARAVAEHCGTVHHELRIRPRDFIPRLPEIVRHLDEPIGDPVTMPNFVLGEHVAEQGFRFVFNGEGGDPLFGGPKNLPMLLHHWYGVPGGFEPGFRERAYLALYRRAFEEIDPLLQPAFRARIDPQQDLDAVLTPFFEAPIPATFLDRLIAINARLKGAHLILPKVERMLAAAGLTPLSPLFDERLFRLTFQLPGHLKLHQGVEKVLLKQAYRDALPTSTINRPKSGMRVPVYFWFRGDLKRYARARLSPRRLEAQGLFRADRVAQLLRYETEDGPGRYGIRLWMLLMFQLWYDEVLGG